MLIFRAKTDSDYIPVFSTAVVGVNNVKFVRGVPLSFNLILNQLFKRLITMTITYVLYVTGVVVKMFIKTLNKLKTLCLIQKTGTLTT